MWICCSRQISDYYFFFMIFRCIECSKEQFIEIEIFCYIINVFTVTFDQSKAALLNTFINKKYKKSFEQANAHIFLKIKKSNFFNYQNYTTNPFSCESQKGFHGAILKSAGGCVDLNSPFVFPHPWLYISASSQPNRPQEVEALPNTNIHPKATS